MAIKIFLVLLSMLISFLDEIFIQGHDRTAKEKTPPPLGEFSLAEWIVLRNPAKNKRDGRAWLVWVSRRVQV
jgi:hypothetical protein